MTTSDDNSPRLRLASTVTAADDDAAGLIAEALQSAIAQFGQASIALSGGRSPAPMLTTLAALGVDWTAVDVFQVDERCVGDDDPDRNWAMIRRALIEPAGCPASRQHPMPVTEADLPGAAVAYATRLRELAPRGFDVVHLGLGDDGHTASWPPGDPVVDSSADVEVVGPFNGHLRMTLTPPAVNRSRSVIWLVTGDDKQSALRRLVSGDPVEPASRVRRHPNVTIATSVSLER